VDGAVADLAAVVAVLVAAVVLVAVLVVAEILVAEVREAVGNTDLTDLLNPIFTDLGLISYG
jgi:hypothetical protein